MTVGDNLKRILCEKEISAYKLAKDGRVSNSYLSEIINNEKTNPSIKIIIKISKALNVSINDLVG
ncbi:MAG: transcriptional regulator with XRE-family HTH domain [Clostridium sp.]|jgi:transcriptional regulator with XRE-family HTH domain